MALPRLVTFLGEGDEARYLGCKSNGSLCYAFTPLERAAKFEVHRASIDKDYVHIRSCCNNKYWVRSSESEYAIVAGATEPNEDTNSWNCTLFKPAYEKLHGSEYVTFLHVQVGQKVGKTGKSSALEFLLMPQASHLARSRFYDSHMYVVLPKYVSFKDDRGKFYQLISASDVLAQVGPIDILNPRRVYIQASGNDSGATEIVHETSYNRHGNYRFKNLDVNKFWRRSSNWICADHTKPDEWNSDILFWPIKVNNNVIALRNLGNDRFIQRLTEDHYKEDCLKANARSVIQEARLTVVEPVLSREVEVIEFRLKDARIYNQRPLVVGNNSASNMTDTANSSILGFSSKEIMTSTWTNTIGLTLGTTATFTVGLPKIGDTGIEVSTEMSEEYEWGEEKEWQQELSGSYTATVPPHTEVLVKMVATIGKCDVPFSYRQTDTLIDGKLVTNTYDDGMYTGVNAYDLRYEATQKALK